MCRAIAPPCRSAKTSRQVRSWGSMPKVLRASPTVMVRRPTSPPNVLASFLARRCSLSSPSLGLTCLVARIEGLSIPKKSGGLGSSPTTPITRRRRPRGVTPNPRGNAVIQRWLAQWAGRVIFSGTQVLVLGWGIPSHCATHAGGWHLRHPAAGQT
jgi:hypothetical protein